MSKCVIMFVCGSVGFCVCMWREMCLCQDRTVCPHSCWIMKMIFHKRKTAWSLSATGCSEETSEIHQPLSESVHIRWWSRYPSVKMSSSRWSAEFLILWVHRSSDMVLNFLFLPVLYCGLLKGGFSGIFLKKYYTDLCKINPASSSLFGISTCVVVTVCSAPPSACM